MKETPRAAGGVPALRLVVNREGCPLCGARDGDGHPEACPVNEWPPPLDGRRIFTAFRRAVVGLVLVFLLVLMTAPKYGYSFAFGALGCALFYAALLMDSPRGRR